MVVLGGMITSSVDINDRLDGSDSQRAYDLAEAHMPSVSGLNTAIVFKTDDLASTAAVIDEIRALPRIDHVDSPIDHPEQVGPVASPSRRWHSCPMVHQVKRTRRRR